MNRKRRDLDARLWLLASAAGGSLIAIAGCAHVGGKPPRVASAIIGQASAYATVSTSSPDMGDAVKHVAFVDDASRDDELEVEDSDNDGSDESSEERDAETIFVTPVIIPPFAGDFAEQSPASFQAVYTLAEIEQLAISNNPAIAAALATSDKAAGLYHQVGVRPNPTLGYFGTQMADRNTDQHGLFIQQEFVRGNKLELNRQVLSHTNRIQQGVAETQSYRVLTDVRVRYFEAAAAQKELDATVAFADLARRGVEVAQERFEAEEGTKIETLQSQTLLSEVLLAAQQAKVAFKGAWQDLASIAGLPSDVPGRLQTDFRSPSIQPDWQSTYAEIIAQSPELVIARAIVCEKQAFLRRQQVQAIPNVTAQLGAGYDDGTEHGLINLQLSAPIPVTNKNTGNISAAYADYVRATQNAQRIERSIQSRLARAAQDHDAAFASVRQYEDEILPQIEESLLLSEEAYAAGELDFLQVLVVRRSFFESNVRFIRAQGKLAQAQALIDGSLLSGGLDAPEDYTDGDGIRSASFGGQ